MFKIKDYTGDVKNVKYKFKLNKGNYIEFDIENICGCFDEFYVVCDFEKSNIEKVVYIDDKVCIVTFFDGQSVEFVLTEDEEVNVNIYSDNIIIVVVDVMISNDVKVIINDK